MLQKLKVASQSGEKIDLAALGLNDIGDIIDDMQENEKIMEDMQKPWEQKLAEAKAKSHIDHQAIEEE